MKRRERHPEFEITEQPHQVSVRAGAEHYHPWQLLRKEAECLEERTLKAEALLQKVDEAHDDAKRKLLLGFIRDVMDNLDRSLEDENGRQTDPATHRWVKRLQLIRRASEQLLAREHVVPIDVASAPPGMIDVAGIEERHDMPEGAVIGVIWRGYLWKGEILRAPKVVVARNPASIGPTTTEGPQR